MLSERKQGFSAGQFPVSAYGGSLKNLNDLNRARDGSVERPCFLLIHIRILQVIITPNIAQQHALL
jgi:hypothetical protein